MRCLVTALALCISLFESSLGASVYISPLGKDAGECDDSSTACRTLAYAVKHAKDEDNIRVMPGVYSGVGNFIDFTATSVPKNLTLVAHETTTSPRSYTFNALGEYAVMRLGTGNKVQGIGFTGVRSQTTASMGIMWLAGSAEVRDCEFWDNGKSIGITGNAATTQVQIHSTKFDLPCSDKTCSSGVGIDFLRQSSYSPVVDATDLRFSGTGTGIRISVGTLRVFGIAATGLTTVFNGGESSYGDFELEVTNGHFKNNSRVFYAYGFDPKLYHYTGRARFEKCVFEEGHCDACDGPAIRAGKRITVAVTTSTFSDNRAGEGKSGAKMGHGGAIYCDDTATINIDESTFTDNKAVDGSPAWCHAHCGFVATKAQLSGNTADKDTGRCPW
eukprot:m.45613 g.45613  ORF g.45613 m.45613 type:complete len:388 (+) comp8662_c1_seq1:82-1245(+)